MSSQVAIDLNDNGIIVSDGQHVLIESPGYIIDIDGQEWIGEEARNKAQLYSSECNNRFWSELAQTQINAVNQANAKLALRHLSFVWQQISVSVEAVVLAVPATFTKAGLGFLLGICKQLSIPVRAMIHQAVLVPKQLNHNGITIHLDMQLHHTAMTLVQERNDEFSVSRVEVLDDVNFTSMYAAAADYITQAFISANRLDPMHSAELEQQLFNQLPAWLEQVQSSNSLQCHLEYQNNNYEAMIDAEALKAILESRLNKIFNTLLSFDAEQARIACVPEIIDKQFGFNRYAYNHGIMVRNLPVGYHAHRSLIHANQLINYDAQIYLNKQLPYTMLTDPLRKPANHRSVVLKQQATHVVYRHHAYPISDSLYVFENKDVGLQIHNELTSEVQRKWLVIHKTSTQVIVNMLDEENIKLNQQQLQSNAQISIGDCIMIGAYEDELMFIRVQ